MSNAGAIKGGGVFVEIGADPRKFFATLNKVNKAMGDMGRSLAGAGAKIGGIGVATLAPFAAAVRQGTAYQSTLLNIQASTGATAQELDRLKAASMQMSQAMGVGPTQIASSFLELLKAGMTVEQVLGGAGQAAIEFATVGQMDVAAAGVVMADAMKVFGVSADTAANAISSAADASSTSIEGMSQAFSQVSAVADLANQSIGDTSAALAILANAGVKGSDAGTSLKTMLLRLMAPADEAVDSLTAIGLSVASFRNADGSMKPLVEIIRTLNGAMGGLNQAAKDDIFKNIFGQDAIRAAAILTSTGVDGFNEMTEAMGKAMPVGEKFKTMMSGLAGAAGNIVAALERFAIAVSDAVGPALMSVVTPLVGFINGLTDLASKNKEAVATIAKFGVAAIAIGGSLTGLGLSLQLAAFGMGGLGKAVALLLSPLTMLARNVTLVGTSFALAMPHTIKLAGTISSSMLAASASVVSFASSSTRAMAVFAASSSASAVAFASSTISNLGRMSGAAATAAQAMFPVFFTGFNRAISAGDGFFSAAYRGLRGMAMASAGVRSAMAAISTGGFAKFAGDIVYGLQLTYKSFTWWASGVASKLAVYSASVASAAAAPMAKFAADITYGLQFTFKTFAWWASGVAAKLAAYAGGTATAAAASAVNAVRSGVAWVASALPGVVAFVGGALSGFAAYLGAAASAVAGSVASAAAVAAAWLAPLAPFLLLSAAVAGVGALLYAFKDQVGAAFSGVAGLVGQAAEAIGGGLNQAAADGMVVLSDLATTATTTFNGIYAAVAAGDLAGAMDVLWAGLTAGWLRGVEAIMGYVDPWISTFQNTFTYAGTEIAVGWEQMWSGLSATANTIGAYLMGAFDNIVNGVLAAWDKLEAGILKSWNYVQSFFRKGFNLEAENKKVDSQMTARARARELARPGIKGRTEKAAAENEQAAKETQARVDAMRAGADATAQGRLDENARRAEERRAATLGAEATLNNLVRGQAETRARNQQAEDLGANIAKVGTIDGLRELSDEFHALAAAGRLTTEQQELLGKAMDDATERIMGDGAQIDAAQKAQEGASLAGVAGPSSSEVVGTFSSSLSGMGFGGEMSTMSQIATNTKRTADATEMMARHQPHVGA